MDSGAGTTICDDHNLYIPKSIEKCPGEVIWGDGSTRRIQYSGKAPGIGKMVNTGGAASTHLISVGATLDELTNSANNDFVMGFDQNASYLIRGAKFKRGSDGLFRLRQQNPNAPVMRTATRGKGSAAVYEVPLYDAQISQSVNDIEECAFSASIQKVYACKAHMFAYPKEPKWESLHYKHSVYDARVGIPSSNSYAMAKDIMERLPCVFPHRRWDGQAGVGTSWNFPKLHQMHHIADQIRR